MYKVAAIHMVHIAWLLLLTLTVVYLLIELPLVAPLAITVLVNLAVNQCALTKLENYFRKQAGMPGLKNGWFRFYFIDGRPWKL